MRTGQWGDDRHRVAGHVVTVAALAVSDVRALLLIDVVDSTALAARLGDTAASALWAAHDRLARDLLPGWRGLEIDHTDGFLLMFETAADALGYAFAYHRALRTLPEPVQARAGVHVGPVILRHNNAADVKHGAKPIEVEGLAKPIAARVMAAALGGQTLITRAALDALDAPAVRIQAYGYWRVKGVAEPIELFEAGDEDAPFVPPPDGDKIWRVVQTHELWLPAREVRHSLPAERDTFVGRREPLGELARRFEGGARLVSVLGMGGTGKTRLAIRFGWSWLGDFAGGVWFCDLSQARDLDGIASAVAEGLEVPLGQDDPTVKLAGAIAGRGHCLVILDNFEQVARHAETTLGRWLDAAPEAHFLVTTREVLGLTGEQTFALAPLPEPEATELFVGRAQGAKHDLALTADDLAAISPLMKLLDGLPLAIELAAARVRVMQPRMLLTRMSERFRLLASTGDRHDRQATLRATLDWSWELLSAADRLALAQLSVFEGGFTLEAAEAVLDLTVLDDTPWPTDTVHSLVDKSLVRALPDARFGLLLSIQDYAAERFRHDPLCVGGGPAAERTARERHCAYFAAIGMATVVADGCADLDNLVVACRRAVSWGAAGPAADTLDGAWAALRYRGPFSTGIALANDVATLPGLTSEARARVEIVSGTALASTGQSAAAQAHFENGLALARQAGARRTEARALAQLGYQDLWEGRIDAARAGYAVATELAREHGDHDVECSALNGVGIIAEQLGRPEEARIHYETALAVARRYRDRHWEGSMLGNLGGVCAALGELEQACSFYEQSLVIARSLGDREREGNALCNLGFARFTQGDMQPARDHSAAALAAARELGHARLECVVLCNLGLIDEAAGRPDDANTRFESALSLAHELGDRRSAGQILTYLGLLHARQARFPQAHASLDAGEALLHEVMDLPSLALLHCSRAEACGLAGAIDAANSALQAAEALAGQLHAGPESELGTALARVRTLIERGLQT